jgi:rubrerythrin
MVSFSLQQAIETAIHAEELGIKFYSEMAKKFSAQENLKKVFEILALDEVEHKKQFQGLLPESSNFGKTLSEDDILYFKGCDISKFFPKMEEISENLTSDEVLKYAFEFEKESVLFYSGIKDLMGVHDKLDIIIAKEKGHMTKLMKYMMTEGQFRGTEDNF